MQQVTLRDVANKLGVSYVAVSLALRDRGRISEELRTRIKKEALEMGYRPDPTARALVQYRQSKPTGAIHAALAWINLWKNPKTLRSYREFDLYWQGASAAADSAGYRLEEFIINEELSLSRLQKILTTRNMQGIIIPPHGIPIDWGTFDWSRFSAVRIGHSVREPDVYVVAPDQVSNSILAFTRIKELGYKRIGFVANKDYSAEPSRWFSGGFLMMQLKERPSDRVPPLLFEEQKREEAQELLLAWMKRHKPDAILSECSMLRKMLENGGYEVPRDVGLATFSVLDGNADAGIYQNPEVIGKAASEILIALINRNERGPSPDYRTSTVKGRWVDGSTLPPR